MTANWAENFRSGSIFVLPKIQETWLALPITNSLSSSLGLAHPAEGLPDGDRRPDRVYGRNRYPGREWHPCPPAIGAGRQASSTTGNRPNRSGANGSAHRTAGRN